MHVRQVLTASCGIMPDIVLFTGVRFPLGKELALPEMCNKL
jgi:hypothetical protein